MSPPRVNKAPRPTLPGLPHSFKPSKGYKGGRTAKQKPGIMNGAEEDRARELDAMVRAGIIAGYWFQPQKYRLADEQAWYTADFLVAMNDGLLVVEEIKGHRETAAILRVRVAASLLPYLFVIVEKRLKRDGGGWDFTVLKGWRDEVEPPSIYRPGGQAQFSPKALGALGVHGEAPLLDPQAVEIREKREAIVEALTADIPRVEAPPVKAPKKRTRSEFGAVCSCLVNGKRLGDFKGCPAHYMQPVGEVVGTHANGRPLSVTDVGEDADKLF